MSTSKRPALLEYMYGGLFGPIPVSAFAWSLRGDCNLLTVPFAIAAHVRGM
jgi:hypothetical protein